MSEGPSGCLTIFNYFIEVDFIKSIFSQSGMTLYRRWMSSLERKRRNENEKPKGREAHHEVNRTGQAWGSVPEKSVVDGYEVVTGFHHSKCACGAVIRIDGRGWAACEDCGEIHNDYFNSSNYDKNRSMQEFARLMNYDKIRA